jgi:hypothetical protein
VGALIAQAVLIGEKIQTICNWDSATSNGKQSQVCREKIRGPIRRAGTKELWLNGQPERVEVPSFVNPIDFAA